MKKGLNRTTETTSLLSSEHLIKAQNFEPKINGVKVRNGMGVVTEFDGDTRAITPIAAERVTISGLEFILIVSADGFLYGVVPEKKNKVFYIYRRLYEYSSLLALVTDGIETPPNRVKIIKVAKFIYVLSDVRNVVIAADGIASIESDWPAFGDYILVDGWDATGGDADGHTPKLFPTGGWSAPLVEDDQIYIRTRSEFGGLGAKSKPANVPYPDSYLVAGAPGMRQDPWGVSNSNKIQKKIIGHGYRTSNFDSGRETYNVNWNIADTHSVGDNLGMVANGSAYKWRNGSVFQIDELPDNQFQVLLDQGSSVAASAHAAKYQDSYENYNSGTEYQMYLLVNHDGEAKLVLKNSLGAKYSSGDYIYIKKLITGWNSAVTGSEEDILDTSIVLKVTSAASYLSDGGSTHYDSYITTANNEWQVTVNTAAGAEANSARVYDVEIEGFSNIQDYIEGSRFYDGTNQHYLTYTAFGVYVVIDSAGDFVDPVIFTAPFEKAPSSAATSLEVDADYMTHDENFWNSYDADSDTVTLAVNYNIDSGGLFLDNPNITRDILLLYYQNADTDGTYIDLIDYTKYTDIFRVGENSDMWLNGAIHIRRHDEFGTASEVAGELYNWSGLHVPPVAMSKWTLYGHAMTKFEVRAVGTWDDVAFFNNGFVFADGNQLKITNALLEWDPSATITVEGDVLQLIPLGQRLMVITADSILSVDDKFRVEPMHKVRVVKAVAVANQMFFIDNNGMLYNTTFAQIPAGSIAQQTRNPYIVVESNGEIIREDTENWYVYDMLYHDNRLYIATNIGVFIYNFKFQSWWKYDLPVEAILKMIEYDDQILFIGGDYDNTDFAANYSWITAMGGLS